MNRQLHLAVLLGAAAALEGGWLEGGMKTAAAKERPSGLEDQLQQTSSAVRRAVEAETISSEKEEKTPVEKAIDRIFASGATITAPEDDYNQKRIAYWKKRFARPGGKWVKAWERMKERGHLEMVVKICDEEGVPPELVFIALIESGWRSNTTSPAGARGYWQFTESTARHRGLRVDAEAGVDERTHPRKSTRAAVRYLKFLYNLTYEWDKQRRPDDEELDDSVRWMFALWAYNRGPKYVALAYEKYEGNVATYQEKLPARLEEHGDYPNRFFGIREFLRDHEQLKGKQDLEE